MMQAAVSLTLLILICQVGSSMQACQECECCNGENACDSDGKCTNGCKPGYYGNKCMYKCGKGCINNVCDGFNGSCTCKSNDFQEGTCDFCVNGKYGEECNQTCPSNCSSCLSPTACSFCKHGLYYGPYCQYRCSLGCNPFQCNKDSGHCGGVCRTGYNGDRCDTCSPGVYGTYCDLNCSENCFSCISETNCTKCKDGFYSETCTLSCPAGCKEKCSFANGQCLDCEPGFNGEFCNNTCVDGTYGYNCSKFCNETDTICRVCFADELNNYGGCIQCNSGYYPVISPGEYYSTCENCSFNCRDHECNTLGYCSNGCFRGKWGDSCNKDCILDCLECNQTDGKCLECSNKTFSNDCSKNCSTDCNIISSGRICASDAGECLHGCETNTIYGDYCDKECNDNCNNKSCDWKTGHCLDGCVINHYGLFCDKKCAGSCLSNKDQRVCDNDQGHCLYGCKDGFYGSGCENSCSSHCINATCNQITAECSYGCMKGYTGPDCNQATTPGPEGYSTGALIGSSVGSGLVGIFIGVTFMLAISIWRRRQRNNIQSEVESERTTVPNESRTTDHTYESGAIVEYEDLKSRDNRMYSQLTSNELEATQAAEYVEFN